MSSGKVDCVMFSICFLILTDLRADGGNGTSIQSEDCLRINVITPSNATKLPVYLYS